MTEATVQRAKELAFTAHASRVRRGLDQPQGGCYLKAAKRALFH